MPTLGQIIREKVADGRLPVREPVKTWAGYGRGQPCSACELPILAAQAEYEFEDGDATYRFHIGCYGLWEAERRRRGGGGTTRDGSP
ncbi:MAG TPA: hypothetical protein VGD07_02700 [Methylomirabilota bacterium]